MVQRNSPQGAPASLTRHAPYISLSLHLFTGIQSAALAAATPLLLRAAWTQRAIGILVALVGVELFNIARLVQLYLLGVHWPEGFDVAH
mgnify:CR=1 FL=1